jgi:tetratricopeptide (TPR) repeat protein
MLKRRTKIVLILAGLVVAVGWLAWPYYALYDLITAVKNGDAVALEERVAWDSVRQGLRGDLSAFLLQKLSADAKARNNDAGAALGAGLAAAFGPAIINQLIDSYVTPQTISTLIRTGKPSVPIGGTPTADTSGEQKHQPDLKLVRFAFFSGGPFTFKVEIAPEGGSVQKELGLLFKWSGDWKLTRIILPADAMDAFQSARRVTPSAESVRTKTAFSTVVVAAVPLTFGTVLTRENVIEIPWAFASIPEGAFATVDQLFKDGRRVALTPMQRNELILKTRIANQPNTSNNFDLGKTYLDRGEYDLAIQKFTEVIRLDPKNALAYLFRGSTHRLKRDYDRAIADLNEAIRLGPNQEGLYNIRGLAYDDKGDHDRAIADYNEAIRLNPKYATAYSNRGGAYYSKGQFDRAITDYGEAIRLDPKNALAYSNRGIVHEKKGGLQQALTDYKLAISLDPQLAAAAEGAKRVTQLIALQNRKNTP